MPIYQYRGRNAYCVDKPVYGGDARSGQVECFLIRLPIGPQRLIGKPFSFQNCFSLGSHRSALLLRFAVNCGIIKCVQTQQPVHFQSERKTASHEKAIPVFPLNIL